MQYFAVVLTLGGTDAARMKPGARVRALLTLDEVPGALAVPRQAVFERGGRTVVYQHRAGGGFSPVPVTLGPSGMGRVVIASGLKPGDTVALGDPARGPDASGTLGTQGKTPPPEPSSSSASRARTPP